MSLVLMEKEEPKASSILVVIFLVLLVGALVVDLITYWPIFVARPWRMAYVPRLEACKQS